MCIGILGLVIYNDIHTWSRIDKKHRKYYLAFIANAILCIMAIIVILYKGLWIEYILSLAITDILMIDSFVRKILMIKDLKNKRFQKKSEENK